MVDAMDSPSIVQGVPMRGFVRVHDRRARHKALGDFNAVAFVACNESRGAALALAKGDNNATLAGLIFGKATILAILFLVLRTDVAAEIGTINLDNAVKL